jgi:hypothetical protein
MDAHPSYHQDEQFRERNAHPENHNEMIPFIQRKCNPKSRGYFL